MRTFISYANGHRERLERTFSAVEFNRIANNIAHLQLAYREGTVFKAAVDASARFMDFPRCWDFTSGQITYLRRFCGGLATAFLNTATVESDFSVLGWENDNYRTALTDF